MSSLHGFRKQIYCHAAFSAIFAPLPVRPVATITGR